MLCRYLSEHPEHLGRLKMGEPGSMWLRPKAKKAVELPGFYSMGLKQCRWAHYPKPTRFLSDIPGLAKEGWIGMPQLDDRRVYVGPIPPCDHLHQVELVGCNPSGEFMTKATDCAAWPSGMCEMVAKHMVEDFVANPDRSRRKAALIKDAPTQEDVDLPTSDEDSDGQVRPKLGAGHWGRGPPRACGTWLRPRQFHDGGGLCSPGRWRKADRQLPGGAMDVLRTALIQTLLSFGRSTGQQDWVEKTFWSMVRGGLSQDPFPTELLEKMRATTSAVMPSMGNFDCSTLVDEGQPPLLDMHVCLLRVAGDPDYKWIVKCKKGMRNRGEQPHAPHSCGL